MLALIEQRWGLAGRLSALLAALLCAYGLLVAAVGAQLLQRQQQQGLQQLSHGLARHIVEHWPRVSQASGGEADRRELDAVLAMLMVVNPAIEVYVLDAEGRVRAYLGDPAAVRLQRVDLAPLQAFLAGAELPVLGSDPKGGGQDKIFSAARFAPRPGEAQPPGYLYVVLQGQAQAQVAGHIGQQRLWQGLAALLLLALLLTLALGLGLIRRLTRPLRQLARRMAAYGPGASAAPAAASRGDEVQAIAQAFEAMAQRIDRQLRERAADQAAHQELVANLAHDLRSPLMVLHGHMETLQRFELDAAAARHLDIALGQSDKVRRLSQQLFELAALQGKRQLLQRERSSIKHKKLFFSKWHHILLNQT